MLQVYNKRYNDPFYKYPNRIKRQCVNETHHYQSQHDGYSLSLSLSPSLSPSPPPNNNNKRERDEGCNKIFDNTTIKKSKDSFDCSHESNVNLKRNAINNSNARPQKRVSNENDYISLEHVDLYDSNFQYNPLKLVFL